MKKNVIMVTIGNGEELAMDKMPRIIPDEKKYCGNCAAYGDHQKTDDEIEGDFFVCKVGNKKITPFYKFCSRWRYSLELTEWERSMGLYDE